jgi:hypothetical protein
MRSLRVKWRQDVRIAADVKTLRERAGGVVDALEFQRVHDTSRQRHWWILPDAVNTVKCSRWWRKHRPKHIELTRNNKLTYIDASCWLFSPLAYCECPTSIIQAWYSIGRTKGIHYMCHHFSFQKPLRPHAFRPLYVGRSGIVKCCPCGTLSA